MGDEIDQAHFVQQDYDRFDEKLQQETELVRSLFADRAFDNQSRVLGYELELCLLDKNGEPSKNNREIIDRCANPLLTTELARFNLEINGNPFAVNPGVLGQIATDLERLYHQVDQTARDLDTRVGLFGVLPSLRPEHLDTATHMTELHRYRQLSEQLIAMRGRPVQLHVKGEELVTIEKNDVMLEALATSLQIHLQLPFDEIVPAYHAALWSSMLVLGAVSNSPLVFEKCCWQETRVAIFKQAVDTRNPQEIENRIVPRVHFGKGYIDSFLDLFEDNFYYSPILPAVVDAPPGELRHLSLHNGTIWRWVRPIIAENADGNYHLRLELRVVPAGPTVVDTMANIAFYVGLTEGLKQLGDELTGVPFATLETDFYRAAREGLRAQVHWVDGEANSLKQLILQKAIPIARRGLQNSGIEGGEYWLDIIQARVESEATGSNWILSHWRKHADSSRLVRDYLAQAEGNRPVHLWEPE